MQSHHSDTKILWRKRYVFFKTPFETAIQTKMESEGGIASSNARTGKWAALTAADVVPVLKDDFALVKLCNQQRLALSSSPSQSNFRVMAYMVITADDVEGYEIIEGANMEEGYIGGAICAERACMSRLRFFVNPAICLVVVTTDSQGAISPGLLCRQYMMSMAASDTPVVIGNGPSTTAARCRIGDLLPHPYVYRKVLRKEIISFMSGHASKCNDAGWTESEVKVYEAARLAATCDIKVDVHPVQLGAAIMFQDGTIEKAHVLKGLEYGCTVCPVVQLLQPSEKKKLQLCFSQEEWRKSSQDYDDVDDDGASPICIAMVDQYGVAHAPFASARALLTEHGYARLRVLVHTSDGTATSCRAEELTPPPPGAEMLTHDDFTQ